MTDILFWHNSEVLCASADGPGGADLRIVLSAGAVERRPDASTVASGSVTAGFIRPLEVVLRQADVSGDRLSDCIGVIAEGEWRVEGPGGSGQALRHITLPWSSAKPLCLSLRFRNGCALKAIAATGHCIPADDALFMESYAC